MDVLSTPRRVELDEEILGVVRDNGVELIGDEDVYTLVLHGRDLLTFDRGGDLAVDKVGDEGGDGLEVDGGGLREGELGHSLHVLDGERGPDGLGEVERLGVVGELHRMSSVPAAGRRVRWVLTLVASIQTKLTLPLCSLATGSIALVISCLLGSLASTKMYARGSPASE